MPGNYRLFQPKTEPLAKGEKKKGKSNPKEGEKGHKANQKEAPKDRPGGADF